MPRRTTVVLEDDSYRKLVEESIKRYGTPRALSKVINDLVDEKSTAAAKGSNATKESVLLKLLYSKKVARTSPREFEKTRRELSSRLESRS